MTHPVLARARVALIRAQFLVKAGDLDGAAAALAKADALAAAWRVGCPPKTSAQVVGGIAREVFGE